MEMGWESWHVQEANGPSCIHTPDHAGEAEGRWPPAPAHVPNTRCPTVSTRTLLAHLSVRQCPAVVAPGRVRACVCGGQGRGKRVGWEVSGGGEKRSRDVTLWSSARPFRVEELGPWRPPLIPSPT